MSDYWHDQYYKLEEEHIKRLAEIEALRAKLADLEEKLKHESDVNAALSKQSQEYWQDRENAAEYNRELTAKLAAADGVVDALKNLSADQIAREVEPIWGSNPTADEKRAMQFFLSAIVRIVLSRVCHD